MCQRKTEFWCTDINLLKTFIDIYTPKKLFYGYVIIVYVHCAICQKQIYKMSISDHLY